MKKLILSLLLIAIITATKIYGQSFDWNIRGGLNLMNSMTDGKDVSFLYHAGAEFGLRISKFGIYGEVLYSMHENQYGGDPIDYFIPALITKWYLHRLFFMEFGGSYLSKMGDSGVEDDTLNPDGDIFLSAGLGVKLSKFQFSLRSTSKSNPSYALIQATAAIGF